MDQVVTRTEKIKDGDYILEEGTWAFYAYVLQSGKAKVVKNVHGKQVLVGALKKGDLFGEMSFLGGAKRTASVIADGDVEVGMIPRDTFMEALSQLPREMRDKLEAMVSDLTCISETCGHLLTRIQDLQNIKSRMVEVKSLKSRMIEIKSLERGMEKMPELLQQITISLAQRLNLAIEACTQLSTLLEEAINPIDSISVTLAKKSR